MCVLRGDKDLNVRGRHPTVFPVQLPPWLPHDIMAKMVDKFENILLNEITFMHKPSCTKKHSRHPSKQSISGLSIASDDSDSSVEIGFPPTADDVR
jgi:hypothetical protein